MLLRICLLCLLCWGILLMPITQLNLMGTCDSEGELQVSLIGGGPSSLLPLVATTSKYAVTRYFGDPVDSFIFRGRDPQKTLYILLQIARKFEDYSSLFEATVLYYRYINAHAEYFKTNLSKAISECYNLAGRYPPKGLEGEVLLYQTDMDSFIPVKLLKDGTLQLTIESARFPNEIIVLKKCEENACSKPHKQADFVLLLPRTINLKTAKASVTVKAKQGANFLVFPPKLHGSLHYLTVFFDSWEVPEKFTKENYDVIINRAGFGYPDDNTEKVMAALNRDYVAFVHDVLISAKSSTGLNPLQEKLLTTCAKYLQKIEDKGSLLKQYSTFVVVGAGRAAGEMSRRLRNDIIHQKTENGSVLSEYDFTPPLSFQAEEARLKKSLNLRQKTVIVVDHHEDKIKSSSIEKIATAQSYCDFLYELTKFDFVPKLSRNSDLERYKAFYNKLASFNSRSGTGVSMEMQSYLERLLEQRNAIDSFILLLVPGREETFWKAPVESELKQLYDSGKLKKGEVLEVKVGGSKQKGPEETGKYDFKRIHDSHYRRENLPFLSLFHDDIERDRCDPAMAISLLQGFTDAQYESIAAYRRPNL